MTVNTEDLPVETVADSLNPDWVWDVYAGGESVLRNHNGDAIGTNWGGRLNVQRYGAVSSDVPLNDAAPALLTNLGKAIELLRAGALKKGVDTFDPRVQLSLTLTLNRS
jgi:hypothetical protein